MQQAKSTNSNLKNTKRWAKDIEGIMECFDIFVVIMNLYINLICSFNMYICAVLKCMHNHATMKVFGKVIILLL
jgi:hypothetical protein